MGREGEGETCVTICFSHSPSPPRFQLSAGSFELHILQVLLHPLLEDLGLHGGDGEAGAAEALGAGIRGRGKITWGQVSA